MSFKILTGQHSNRIAISLRKKKEMDKTAVIALTIGTWILGGEVAQATNPSLGSSFQEWCLNKTSLSAEARKTVEVLLEEAGTSDCKQADDNLSSRTELDLSFSHITDVVRFVAA